MKSARAEFVGSAIALAAGLHSKFDRAYISEQFPLLHLHQATVKGIHARLLGDGEPINFRGLNRVAQTFETRQSEKIIVAGSQFGPALVSVAALAATGVKVAGAYWALSRASREILNKHRVHLVNLAAQKNRFVLIAELRNLHANGYAIWLMCEAPGKSRTRCDFLGYGVSCANLIEVYARLNRCTVIPTYCRLLSDNDVSVHCDAPITDYQNMTQRLLSGLETLIYDNPTNYLWGGTSIIFSDSHALLNGLRYLPDFLKWREQAVANRRHKSITSV